MNDKLWGGVLLTLTTLGLLYFTLWLLVTPFLEGDVEDLEAYFPPRDLAIALTTCALVGVLAITGCSLGCMLMEQAPPQLERCKT